MAVHHTIQHMIESRALYPKPITGDSNLYTDLGFDSLSFLSLLVEIEKAFSISFDITEIQECLLVDALISTVSGKLAQRGHDHA